MEFHLCLCLEVFESCICCGSRVGGVAVRADLVAVFLSNGRAAYHDPYLVTDAGSFALLDYRFHFTHGGSEKCGANDQISVVFLCLSNELFSGLR